MKKYFINAISLTGAYQIWFLTSLFNITNPTFADSFYEYKNGNRYLCTLVQEQPPSCEYIYNGVYCPAAGEQCSYIHNAVYCGHSCSYIYNGVYCAKQGETCEYIYNGVYCGVNCSYIYNGVHCSTGGKASPAHPAQPRR